MQSERNGHANRPGEQMQRMSVLFHVVTIFVIFGKSAVASAGLTLAALGIFNVVVEAITHSWVFGGKYLPVVVSVGGLVGGVLTTATRNAKTIT
jgi:hypothetical protein